MQRLPAINPFDTSKYPNGIGTFDIGAANEGSKILFYNENPGNINLDFLNGSTDTLHAWEANYWVLDADTKQIEWQIDANSLNVSTPPISAVFMTLYGPQERLGGTYPMALIRQASVGNLGGIQTSNVAQVINDGQALQQVVEATLLGHASSDVIINNDGSYTLKGAGLLAAVGVLTHILGTLTVDQAATFAAAINASAAINANGAGVGLAVAHNETIAGTLGVTGDSQFSTASFSGEITANSDLKTNTVRDNNTGAVVLDMSTPSTTNGTAGTFTVNTEVWGPKLKILHIGFAAYVNNVTVTIALPSTFVRGFFYIGGIGDGSASNVINFLLNGGGVGAEVITGFGSGTGGGTTANGVTSVFRNSFGNIVSSINQVKIGTTTVAANGSIILIGA